MEWVEVTGKTVEVAQAAALDHLGVHESEAEFNIVSEGRPGLFGLFSQDARVRARVLPKQPRPKQERRPRKGKGGGGKSGGGRGGGGGRDGGKASGRSGQKADGAGGSDKQAAKGRSQSDANDAGKERAGGAKANSTEAAKGGRRGGKGQADRKPDRAEPDSSASTGSTDPERGPRQRNRQKAAKDVTSPGDVGAQGDSPADSPTETPSSTRNDAADGERTAQSLASAKKPTTATKAGSTAVVAGAVAAQAKSSSDRRSPAPNRDDKQEEIMSTDEITVEQQGEIASDFLDGLLEAFGADGEIKSTMIEDDVIEVAVHGKDLGLMIGPKGATLHAIQELARTAVQRSGQGTHRGRLLLDVGGYRQHRRAALEQFAGQVAERVIAENKEHALEPMNSADRKAIHDAVNEIEGVKTISEGEDPRRRIVILPAD